MSEELIVKAESGGNIPPHPEDQYAATCIDIIDLGVVETTWQGRTKQQRKIVLRFFCGEYFYTADGQEKRPLWVDKRLTFSLHEKGAMRPFLESWRGQKFSDAELHDGFNVAKLYKAPAFIQVEHNVTPERVYANVKTIMKLPKNMEAPGIPEGYVRVKDRPPKDGDHAPNGFRGGSEPDDDLPFAPLPSWI